VADASAGAAVVQTDDADDPGTWWTLVHQSNGHYQIRNARSGQMINVAGASGRLGAPLVQWPGQQVREANDKWLPVRNSDGTYSFYSRNSQLALDNPGGGTTAGTQYVQSSPNDGTPQRFDLIPR
jgi:hypothetical protein